MWQLKPVGGEKYSRERLPCVIIQLLGGGALQRNMRGGNMRARFEGEKELSLGV